MLLDTTQLPGAGTCKTSLSCSHNLFTSAHTLWHPLMVICGRQLFQEVGDIDSAELFKDMSPLISGGKVMKSHPLTH